MAFYIVTNDEQSALEWGIQIAERFNRHIFENDDTWTEAVPSWLSTGFAYWIETEDASEELFCCVPVIRYGCVPDFSTW